MNQGILELAADAYHADPCDTPSLSSSIAKILIEASPAHARAAHPRLNPDRKRVEEQKFDIGNVAHALLLEGLEIAEVIPHPDWRTNAAKEARDLARAHGRVPLLAHQVTEVYAMVNAIAGRLESLNVDPIPFTAGKPEQTIVWEEQGVLCRALVDWLHDDLSAIDDLKTTSTLANPDAWCRTTLWSIGADIQAVFHSRGVKAVTGAEPEWRFIVAETAPPYELSIVSLSPAARALAEAKVDWALATWKRCLETDTWPGYPREVCFAEPPGWAEAAWMEREAREEMAA